MNEQLAEVILLGTGSSHGVPVNGCKCEVCLSESAKDRRLRTSAYVKYNDLRILIDAGPDIRQQLLHHRIEHIDALLITHEHNDHIIGLDDLRPFNYIHKRPLQVYCSQQVADALVKRFDYIFGPEPYAGALKAELNICDFSIPFTLGNQMIQPIEAIHGDMIVHGFRFGDFTYLTDAKWIAEKELKKMVGTRYLVLNALHFTGHISHLNVEEALAIVAQIQPEHAWLTHVSHFMGLHQKVNAILPDNVHLAYDGLKIDF